MRRPDYDYWIKKADIAMSKSRQNETPDKKSNAGVTPSAKAKL